MKKLGNVFSGEKKRYRDSHIRKNETVQEGGATSPRSVVLKRMNAVAYGEHNETIRALLDSLVEFSVRNRQFALAAKDDSETFEGLIRYECVIVTAFLNIADTAQYFVVESSMARSTSAGLMFSPKNTYSM